MDKIKRNKIVKRVCACVLGVASVAGIVLGVGYGTGLFGSSKIEQGVGGGLALGNIYGNGISLTATSVDTTGTEYESGYSLTATIEPADATNTTINFSVAFEDSSDTWVTDNAASVSDYVVISSSSVLSGESVTVYCKKAFGEQVVITATSDGYNSDMEFVTATCTLEYYKSVTDATLTVTSTALGTASYTGSGTTVTLSSLSSDYTDYSSVVTYSVTCTYGTGTITEDYSTGLKVGSTSITSGSTTSSDLINAMVGTTVTSSSELATAYSALNTLYEAGSNAGVFNLTLTGNTTGHTYSYSYNLKVNPSSMYTFVEGIEFEEEVIYFY